MIQPLYLFILLTSLIASIHAICVCQTHTEYDQITVRTSYSTVVGQHLPLSNTTNFYGVPFATPPLGNLRFRPPQPISKQLGVINATSRGNWCLRIEYLPTPQDSEDCLNLDIVVPNCVDEKNRNALPVIVFIHG